MAKCDVWCNRRIMHAWPPPCMTKNNMSCCICFYRQKETAGQFKRNASWRLPRSGGIYLGGRVYMKQTESHAWPYARPSKTGHATFVRMRKKRQLYIWTTQMILLCSFFYNRASSTVEPLRLCSFFDCSDPSTIRFLFLHNFFYYAASSTASSIMQLLLLYRFF